MMCRALDASTLSSLPDGYFLRLIEPEELPRWMAFPFDTSEQALQHRAYMEAYYQQAYAAREAEFFSRCTMLCDAGGPVGTGFIWPAYEPRQTTLHWLKVLRGYEGKGLGRAMLSHLLSGLEASSYPVYLHTQPESFRAIKLYSDFGFALLTDSQVGLRPNDLQQALPLLKQSMTPEAFDSLRFTKAPAAFLEAVASSSVNQF